jgi:hypothetical protein
LKLYDSSNPTRRRCVDSNKKGNRSTTGCTNGLCYAFNIDGKHHCTLDNTPTLFSEIEYHLPVSIINGRELIEYKCNKHLCNSKKMITIIKNLLLNYTNWNNIIPTKIEDNPIEEKSSTIQQTVSYCLIIFFLINLLFIF